MSLNDLKVGVRKQPNADLEQITGRVAMEEHMGRTRIYIQVHHG
jgi:hypothetical protein